MVSFFLLGGALYLNMLPWSIRLLLVVGALAPLTGMRLGGRVRRDEGAAYPYPAQQSVFNAPGSPGDDDPTGSRW